MAAGTLTLTSGPTWIEATVTGATGSLIGWRFMVDGAWDLWSAFTPLTDPATYRWDDLTPETSYSVWHRVREGTATTVGQAQSISTTAAEGTDGPVMYVGTRRVIAVKFGVSS